MKATFKIKDFEVLEILYYFTWVRFIYDIIDEDTGKILRADNKTDYEYATCGFEGDIETSCELLGIDGEDIDWEYDNLTDKQKEQLEELYKDYYHDIYAECTEDGLDILTEGICRKSPGIGYEESNGDDLIDDIEEEIECFMNDYYDMAKISKFGECAKKYIPNLDEDSLKNDLSKYDIDEQGPVCSDNTLLSLFRNNINPSVSDNELYSIIEKVCLEYAMEMGSSLPETHMKSTESIAGKIFTIEEDTWEEKDVINSLENQFNKLFPSRRLDVIEFEYEEGPEYYFNCLADGINYRIMINSETGNVYWDREL